MMLKRNLNRSALGLVLVALFAVVALRAQTEAPAANTEIRHVVLFALKADVSAEQRKVIETASASLLKDTGLIQHYEWGTDISGGQRAQGFTHCLVMSFRNADDLQKYIVHPAHVAFKEKALPFMEKLLVVDFNPQFTPQAS